MYLKYAVNFQHQVRLEEIVEPTEKSNVIFLSFLRTNANLILYTDF